jgi:hypothetical protein
MAHRSLQGILRAKYTGLIEIYKFISRHIDAVNK